MNTQEYGKGALESGYDLRDFWYEPADKGGFDWEKGYDIEKVLGRKIVTKDQGSSGSCGGQAWGYLGEVLEMIVSGSYEPRSARWIYAHTHVPTGGSNGRVNCGFVRKNGWVKEEHATSYNKKGRPLSEDEYRVIPTLSQEAKEDAEVSKPLPYMGVRANIEIMAQAIADNHGIVIVVNGQDNGTWRTEFPKPPKEKEWGHFLYAGKAKMIDGKKYIGVKNSWGDKTGKQGWQWIGEDYFASGHVREGWAMSWDYKPALHKKLLIQTVKALQELVALLSKK